MAAFPGRLAVSRHHLSGCVPIDGSWVVRTVLPWVLDVRRGLMLLLTRFN